MNGEIEGGFQPGVTSRNLGVTVYLGADGSILQPQEQAIIIECQDLNRLTKRLWSGIVVFRISTPMLGNLLSVHKGLEKAVHDFLLDQSAVLAAFACESYDLKGLFCDNPRALQTDERWETELSCKAAFVSKV